MAVQWPLGKLEIINSALGQCGDTLVNIEDDGSDEWNVASPAYERALAYMLESHGWRQLTEIRTLQPSPTAPADTQYDSAYDLPVDLVHLILVLLNDLPCTWDLLNNQLAVDAGGGTVKIKGIFTTNADPTFGTPTFVSALQAFVMSGIYRGLHEDVGQAERMWNSGKALLEDAKSRHDMQKPRRAMFKSRMTAARRFGRFGSSTGQ
jgi:hypothetical protein